jgi:hypothetical protein
MRHISIEGEEIDKLASMAMEATVNAMVMEGKLTLEQCVEFKEDHVCIVVNGSLYHRIIKKLFGRIDNDYKCLIVKGIAANGKLSEVST